MTMKSANRTSPFLLSASCRQLAAECLAAALEMQARRALRRSIGNLSIRQLQDAGLIQGDLDAARHRGLGHSAAAELKAAATSRAGNW